MFRWDLRIYSLSLGLGIHMLQKRLSVSNFDSVGDRLLK